MTSRREHRDRMSGVEGDKLAKLKALIACDPHAYASEDDTSRPKKRHVDLVVGPVDFSL